MSLWWQATHNRAHSGLPGRHVPEAGPALTGAFHPFAGFLDGFMRNGSRLAPGAGQAASHPVDLPGVISNDSQHHDWLDGARSNPIANHPSGLFAQNTAATSSHSALANLSLQTLITPTATGLTMDNRSGTPILEGEALQWEIQELERAHATAGAVLSRQRRTRIGDEVLVGSERSSGLAGVMGNFGTGEWTGMHGVLAGLAAYVGLRAFM